MSPASSFQPLGLRHVRLIRMRVWMTEWNMDEAYVLDYVLFSRSQQLGFPCYISYNRSWLDQVHPIDPQKWNLLERKFYKSNVMIDTIWNHGVQQAGASFQLFLGGPNFFYYFSMPPDYWKIGKKQDFICSNLMLFIVPFFLSFLFFFFSFFFFFFSFFLGGGDGPPAPPPPNDASGSKQ